MKILLLLALAVPAAGQLTLIKSFPGSTPAYAEVRMDNAGKADYREDAKDENPMTFEIAPADKDAILGLVEKLNRFSRPLESGLKVARMGNKIFRWEKTEVQFNYSEDLDAKALLDWFERICETERSYIALETAAKYDKLGVDRALLQLEISWDNKRLVAPEQMLPLLDRVTKNESFMHMSRSRAADLADKIRNAK